MGKHVSWDINTDCNYSCSYCFLHGRNPAPSCPQTLLLPPERWVEAWDRFYERFGSARIDISGGEPFLYPGFTEILKGLAARHKVCVITNFSSDLSGLRARLAPGEVSLVLSLHPEHAGPAGAFLRRAAALAAEGFKVRITAVGYPPFMGEIRELALACRALGLKFTVSPFFGGYRGSHYPGAYSPAEKEFLEGLLASPAHAAYQLRQASPQGRSCRAGADYCRVGPDGSVRTCLNGPALADFLSPEFDFLREPAPCPSAHCHCILESAYCLPQEEGRAPAPR